MVANLMCSPPCLREASFDVEYDVPGVVDADDRDRDGADALAIVRMAGMGTERDTGAPPRRVGTYRGDA